jgi:mannose-1-phosphate guanylyltransferase
MKSVETPSVVAWRGGELHAGAAATPFAAHGPTRSPLRNLRAILLLAGSVGRNSLSAAARRPAAMLPLDETTCLLDEWQRQAAALTELTDVPALPMRVFSNVAAPQPPPGGWNGAPAAPAAVPVSVERDPGELRGTGGVLHDVARDFDDDAYLLVAAAGQLLVDSLGSAVVALASARADLALCADESGGGGAGGLMLVRCGCLRALPQVGFVDLKEQGLPLVARDHAVRVVRRARPPAMPVRTLADYTRALRWYHGRPRGAAAAPAGDAFGDPFGEDWQPAFGFAERGAEVDGRARLHDSVVLAGARVERGAMLVRSVACPGAVVRRNQTVVDRLVTAAR